jgi:hypothetical protein
MVAHMIGYSGVPAKVFDRLPTLRAPIGSRFLLAAALLATAIPGVCGQAWLEVGDTRLRADLQLLVDANLTSLPLGVWPIPVADIERALTEIESASIESGAYDAVIARIRVAVRAEAADHTHLDVLEASGGRAGLLRDFGTAGREDGEMTLGAAKLANRWALEVRGTIAASPSDEKTFRFDRSHLTFRLGNWLMSANTLDRWWGPGQMSSLILSNNARPMPGLMLDRAMSTPSTLPVLKWLGSWRFTGLLGQMESDRADVQNPLFMGMRVSVRPLHFLDIGLNRTAQFCGEGRTCKLETIKDVLGFNDTPGFTVDPKDQPGNQLAGWDVRIASPWRALPLAVYTQDIGEDRIDLRPTDRLVQYGAEAWHVFSNGDVLRGYWEYSDSTCAAASDLPNFNCAYTNNIFFADGYRYRGRAIGHTTDADSLLRATGLRWLRAAGSEWSLGYRRAALNRDPVPDPYNTVSNGPSDYESVALEWSDNIWNGKLRVQLGYEQIDPLGGVSDDRAFGFLSWRKLL